MELRPLGGVCLGWFSGGGGGLLVGLLGDLEGAVDVVVVVGVGCAVSGGVLGVGGCGWRGLGEAVFFEEGGVGVGVVDVVGGLVGEDGLERGVGVAALVEVLLGGAAECVSVVGAGVGLEEVVDGRPGVG